MDQEQNKTVRPQNRSGTLEDSEDELEEEDMKADIKEPSPTSTSHVSSLSVKVEEFSKSPSVNTSLSRVVNSSSASLATSDRTVAPEIPVSNSTRSKLCKCMKKQPEEGIFQTGFFFLSCECVTLLCNPLNGRLFASFLSGLFLFLLKL